MGKLTWIVSISVVILLLSSFLIFVLPVWGNNSQDAINIVSAEDLCDPGTKNCIDSCRAGNPATCDIRGETVACDCSDPLNQD